MQPIKAIIAAVVKHPMLRSLNTHKYYGIRRIGSKYYPGKPKNKSIVIYNGPFTAKLLKRKEEFVIVRGKDGKYKLFRNRYFQSLMQESPLSIRLRLAFAISLLEDIK